MEALIITVVVCVFVVLIAASIIVLVGHILYGLFWGTVLLVRFVCDGKRAP